MHAILLVTDTACSAKVRPPWNDALGAGAGEELHGDKDRLVPEEATRG